jgi:hypothetical protein
LGPAESCDGTALGGHDCLSLGFLSGELACTADCTFDTSNCIGPECGNGVAEGDEVCDGNDLNDQSCASLGLRGGELACRSDCIGFDTTGCYLPDGASCHSDTECAGEVCFTETGKGYPGGYCTRTCSEVDSCPMGSVCVELVDGSYCFQSCLSAADCRVAYGCFDTFGQGDTYCWPHCEDPTECLDSMDCNRWTGLCADPISGADNGVACGGSNGCKGTCTYWPHASNEGYCVSFCRLSSGRCPGDGICSDIFSSTRGDLGTCLDGCTSDTECDSSFVCDTNPFGPNTVCMPPMPP